MAFHGEPYLGAWWRPQSWSEPAPYVELREAIVGLYATTDGVYVTTEGGAWVLVSMPAAASTARDWLDDFCAHLERQMGDGDV